MSELKHVNDLIATAAKAHDSGDAMRYSQAALNAANAIRQLKDIELFAPELSSDQIKYMVGRFLGWRLPENFSPDDGISYKRSHHGDTPYPMPTGTNLFDYTQAEAMVRFMADGLFTV